jgi:phage terminase large subunit-like protein
MITASAAISDVNLLGSAFAGPSWDTWKTVLRAAEGLPLTADQLDVFRTVAGDRPPPSRRVKQFWAIVGRRGGKDSIASAITTTAGMNDYRPFLRPRERATVLCLANTREQAKIILRYTRAFFHDNPMPEPLVTRWTEDGFELNNGCEVVIAANSFRLVRGLTLAAVVMDEVGLWRSEESANPDFETYNALLPGLVTLPGAMLVGITTSYRKAGLAYDRWRKYFARTAVMCWCAGGRRRRSTQHFRKLSLMRRSSVIPRRLRRNG